MLCNTGPSFNRLVGMTVGEFNNYSNFQFRTLTLNKNDPDKILEHVAYCESVAKKYPGTTLGGMAERDAKWWTDFVDSM